MRRKIKAVLSKVNFALNRNPKIIKYKNVDVSRYIPEPYKAVLIISADFELAWAWRYAKALENPKQEALNHARIARRNLPIILQLCDKYNIPITWATVGHLFLEKCSKDGNVAHRYVKRLFYHQNQYWRFDKGDWFDDDPCTDWKTSPEWYAPDLIKMILNSDAKHEIGCHTFSHIDCSNDICFPLILISEIEECQKCAQKYGIKLESFVHPGQAIGNLNTLKGLGFNSFRTDDENVLGYPEKHTNGLWEIKSTMELTFRKEWSVNYHIYRYKSVIERALKHNRVCCYWFHPSIDYIFVEKVIPALFEFINSKRKELLVTTTKDYANQLL